MDRQFSGVFYDTIYIGICIILFTVTGRLSGFRLRALSKTQNSLLWSLSNRPQEMRKHHTSSTDLGHRSIGQGSGKQRRVIRLVTRDRHWPQGTATVCTMSKKEYEEPSLHDWLALGDLEVALAPEKRDEDDLDRRKDEIRHLPLLLRILSASQPLSSIPSIIEQHTESVEGTDPLVDEVVSRLEDVAATYSAAEGVDALTSYHAPSICRKISRLPPLKRQKRKGQWKIQDLASVAASPVGGSPRKKRRHSEGLSSAGDEILANDVENDDNDVSGDDDMSVEDSAGDAAQGQRSDTRVEAKAASADSQEAMTTRCLTEIASLVVASLEPFSENKEDEEGSPNGFSLTVTTDSLLSEPGSGLHCHLGATLSGIMHHAPVLRNQHVAASLVAENT